MTKEGLNKLSQLADDDWRSIPFGKSWARAGTLAAVEFMAKYTSFAAKHYSGGSK